MIATRYREHVGMDLLQYGDESENEENGGDDEESRVRTWLTDEEDSDVDLQGSDKKLANTSGDNRVAPLLSAEELFAHDVPKSLVLKSNTEKNIEIKTTTEEIVPKVKAKAIVAKASISSASTSSKGDIALLMDDPPSIGDNRSSGAKIAAKSVQQKRKSGEQISAKDRVKNQRLSGQAGIGSDFKTWRSEEEMRMRQQYD